MHRLVPVLPLAILALLAVACGGSSTSMPNETSDVPFDEADLRAMLSNEEIEAAIPFVIGNMEIQDFKAMAAGSDPN